MKKFYLLSLRQAAANFFFFSFLLMGTTLYAQPLKVGVVGLNHDHAYGLMNQYKKGEVLIIGITEPDAQLVDRYKKRYQLPDSIFYKTIG